MNVSPKIGIDVIRFGMDMNEVRTLWGQPDSIYYFTPLEDQPEDRSVNWEYSNGTELSFDSDDNFLLGSISTTSVLATINGLSFVGNSIKELKFRYPSLFLDDDFEENGRDYVIPELGISIWAFNGVADRLTIFPEYDESGNNIQWPLKVS
jgi:hypothetical protein